jgi:hypothetical protein
VIGVVLSSVGNCLFLIFVSKKYFELTFSKYIAATKMMLLKFGVKALAGGSISEINNQLDIILVGFFYCLRLIVRFFLTEEDKDMYK